MCPSDPLRDGNGGDSIGDEEGEEECCRGIEHLELWGDAVRWGSDFKVNSSRECCMACKEMCGREGGSCLCDTWVFCGDREACGSRFGECWLKKQRDTLGPQLHGSGDKVIWTSGQVFGKTEGIIGLETEYGMLRVKLLPDCAPHSVIYILELLASRFCAGCRFYRAESRGDSWDSEGNRVGHASYGPPFALIQGTLEAYGAEFKDIPTEACPAIKRGSVAWVGSGPEFFISLANHNEWTGAYTAFGHVLPQDMEIADNIAQLPTKSEVFSNVPVSVLEKHVPLRFHRINTSP
ncbi:peptidyl-prolyl cis-trans isomerase-like 3 isoform X2 [Tripterygium wilfordii]|uniref:peptidyl-prolyl cis-trans isomerase-like 3 isoform X2 n=1 Tax=Tripterygium wilfordii TaxID=458696 RepID=UPI0018F812AD|nr:peptidyl-prolyl cis-trans isomerase-like 3 isoform X2 [Tripterygium wilfordii]